ncbi:MAG TPA: hypothetical protein VJ948_11825 [Acidimicrobiia bacterium]|nr:hypothetical protein [Acidimicrobiia bacterium]
MILAHAIGGRTDLPIPTSILLFASAAVLVITFLGLSLIWPRPRLQEGPRYEEGLVAIPTRPVFGLLGLLALLLVIGQVVPDLLDLERETLRATIAPVTVWVVFWLAVPFLGALWGNWYTDLNPWRALGRLGIGRMERIGLPHSLGVWPATVTLVCFAWLELIYPASGDPVVLGIAAIIYTGWLLGWMAMVGRETALAVFDVFTPYNRLISAISPLGRRDDGRLVWRGWLRSLPVLPEWPGLWAFVAAMIGTVSYDGASGAAWFRNLTGGIGETTAGASFLLVAVVGVVMFGYYLACWLAARSSGGDWSPDRVARRFAHTLVPIGLAYAVSHYFTLILFEGQQVLAAVSDPFGLDWDLFGTADRRVQFFLTSSTVIWLLQVGFIVIGHIVGVILAHDRALLDFGPDAVRSQYAMLGLMIALTSLGLMILSG